MPFGSIFQIHHCTCTTPEYDFNNYENLPSLFMEKNGKYSSQAKAVGAIGQPGQLLRLMVDIPAIALASRI